MLNKADIEHQRKLFTYFSSKDWPVLQAELEQYRADIVRTLALLDVSQESERIKHIRYQAQMELVDTWLQLPEENKNLLQKFKDIFVGLIK